MRVSSSLCFGFAMTAILGSLAAPAMAQQPTMFCFTDGSAIRAVRATRQDGMLMLELPGVGLTVSKPEANFYSNQDPCPPPLPPRGAGPNTAPTGLTEPPPPPPPISRFGVHGSNTIGEKLMPALIDAYSKSTYGEASHPRDIAPQQQEFTLGAGTTVKAVIDFQTHGSGSAAPGLASGQALIGMSSRQMKPDEAQMIAHRFPGVDPLASGNEHVLAMDGIAIVVNRNNTVRQLTLEEIGRIFSGAVTSWDQVGGAPRPIKLYRRRNGSGTLDTFNHLVLDPVHLTMSANAEEIESSGLLSSKIASNPDAIGFIAAPHVGDNQALAIGSTCGIVGSPSKFSIKSEEYPLARRLYLYTIGQPSAQEAKAILSYALSDEAQHVISEADSYDLSIEFQNASEQQRWMQRILDDPGMGLPGDKRVPASAVREFGRALAGKQRASMEFRFNFAGFTLDTRARQDVERLRRYLKAPLNAGRRVIVAGFADTDGDFLPNYRLAQRRAETVAELLRTPGEGRRGLRIDVMAFSYLAPVACNDTDAGKAKNRRVEIWMN
jgi:phosphate transport system substrate-binding protein